MDSLGKIRRPYLDALLKANSPWMAWFDTYVERHPEVTVPTCTQIAQDALPHTEKFEPEQYLVYMQIRRRIDNVQMRTIHKNMAERFTVIDDE